MAGLRWIAKVVGKNKWGETIFLYRNANHQVHARTSGPEPWDESVEGKRRHHPVEPIAVSIIA